MGKLNEDKNQNNMKKLLLMATMLLTFGAVNAQIGDCSVKGSRVEIYDAKAGIKHHLVYPQELNFLGLVVQ